MFVTGVELSVMNPGFVPGDSLDERLGQLLAQPEGRQERIAELNARLGDFLAKAVAAVRERFHGRVTYCAIQFERVDWTLFDIVSVELIRSAEVADRYREGVRALVAQGKPVAITGFGASTYRGAGDRGASTVRSCSCSRWRPSRTGPTAIPAPTSTWPAPASSRSWTVTAVTPTPT